MVFKYTAIGHLSRVLLFCVCTILHTTDKHSTLNYRQQDNPKVHGTSCNSSPVKDESVVGLHGIEERKWTHGWLMVYRNAGMHIHTKNN